MLGSRDDDRALRRNDPAHPLERLPQERIRAQEGDVLLRALVSKEPTDEWSESDSSAVDLVQNFEWTNEDQNLVAGYIAADGMSREEAAQKWIADNPDKVEAWLS